MRWLFNAGMLTALTQTIAWCVIFFFASAGASAAYLTVSEIFPLEVRAMAIAVFFSIAQCFGALGPVLYGWLIGDGSDPTMLFYGYLLAAGGDDRRRGGRLVPGRGRRRKVLGGHRHSAGRAGDSAAPRLGPCRGSAAAPLPLTRPTAVAAESL